MILLYISTVEYSQFAKGSSTLGWILFSINILSYQQKLKLVMRTVPTRGKGILIIFSPVTLFAQDSFKPSSDLSEMLLRTLQLEI